jgi:hypothetical protein
MKDKLREIQAYSSNQRDELDYQKKYWFHQWIGKTTALIEDECGKLIKAKYTEFRFKTDADV